MAQSYMLGKSKTKGEATSAAPRTGGGGGGKHVDVSKCDMVTQDRIWTDAVNSEIRLAKDWEENWMFLAEFHAKVLEGMNKETEEQKTTEDEVRSVPVTNSGNYGSRLDTEIGAAMLNMEFQFYSNGRRKKRDKDVICY